MKNIWKIVTWLVASTNRTAPPISIGGFRITFADGVISVDDNTDSPLVLLISYFDTMNTIIVHAIGGATKAERYATIAALGQMYGQTLLPLEEQTGII